MNKGVNIKSIYFEKQVGSSETVVSNLNPLEGGTYIKIPIITTEGLEPINLELVFSIFNLNENTTTCSSIWLVEI